MWKVWVLAAGVWLAAAVMYGLEGQWVFFAVAGLMSVVSSAVAFEKQRRVSAPEVEAEPAASPGLTAKAA